MDQTPFRILNQHFHTNVSHLKRFIRSIINITMLFCFRKKGKALSILTVIMISWLHPIYLIGQKQDSLLEDATLENVIQYGLKNQPLIQQSFIDQTITEKAIRSRLADWYPQINFVYNYQRNFQLPTSIIGGNPIRFGVNNVSATQFNFTQNLFNRDALLAYKTSDEVKLYAQQSTAGKKIDLAVALTKAFYDVLATSQQIKVGEGDVVRLQRSLRDAFNQYTAGITDKTDFIIQQFPIAFQGCFGVA